MVTLSFVQTPPARETFHPMLVAYYDIYRQMGFREIDRYPESHTAVHFPLAAKDLIYFQLDL